MSPRNMLLYAAIYAAQILSWPLAGCAAQQPNAGKPKPPDISAVDTIEAKIAHLTDLDDVRWGAIINALILGGGANNKKNLAKIADILHFKTLSPDFVNAVIANQQLSIDPATRSSLPPSVQGIFPVLRTSDSQRILSIELNIAAIAQGMLGSAYDGDRERIDKYCVWKPSTPVCVSVRILAAQLG